MISGKIDIRYKQGLTSYIDLCWLDFGKISPFFYHYIEITLKGKIIIYPNLILANVKIH
jgi:hypothetical protein